MLLSLRTEDRFLELDCDYWTLKSKDRFSDFRDGDCASFCQRKRHISLVFQQLHIFFVVSEHDECKVLSKTVRSTCSDLGVDHKSKKVRRE